MGEFGDALRKTVVQKTVKFYSFDGNAKCLTAMRFRRPIAFERKNQLCKLLSHRKNRHRNY